VIRMPRPLYIAWRVVESLGQVGTRFVNASVFGGSTRQSTSARAHIEQWPRGRARINSFFRIFGQADHCAASWASEVNDARKTLAINDARNKNVTGI